MSGDVVQVVPTPHAHKPVAILIVEDEPLIASYIWEVLDGAGFTVTGAASSAPEALSLAERDRPQLALVDIRLPGEMDGIELARALRERYAVPAIFLSGIGDAATVARSGVAQPLGFLEKPFRPSQVFNAIARALDAE
jgi:CheY-like chemotaxis protein